MFTIYCVVSVHSNGDTHHVHAYKSYQKAEDRRDALNRIATKLEQRFHYEVHSIDVEE